MPGHNPGDACEPRLRQTVFHPALDGMKTLLSPFYDLNVQSGLGRPADLTYLMEKKKNQVSSAAFPLRKAVWSVLVHLQAADGHIITAGL